MYCLEFDSARIVTGARDQTIKVWALKSGRLLATFYGHRGSVLCLKFDKDWDVVKNRNEQPRKGFMVSGSSDRTVCVWDMWAGPKGEVTAEVRAVLRGHMGGVLDLRIDEQWIVSWCVQISYLLSLIITRLELVQFQGCRHQSMGQNDVGAASHHEWT